MMMSYCGLWSIASIVHRGNVVATRMVKNSHKWDDVDSLTWKVVEFQHNVVSVSERDEKNKALPQTELS